MKRGRIGFLSATMLGVVGFCVGCGSAATVTFPSFDTSRYVPNYADAVMPLRYWENPAVRVRIERGAETRDRSASIAQALANWQDKTGSVVRPSLSSDSGAEIVVRFVTPGTLDPGVQGLTTVHYLVGSPLLLSATVEINAGLSDSALRLVAEHEIGHALGIGEHSPHRDDVMFATPPLSNVITTRDINTVRTAYQFTRAVRRTQKPTGEIAELRIP